MGSNLHMHWNESAGPVNRLNVYGLFNALDVHHQA
jgi:hypothetical protein